MSFPRHVHRQPPSGEPYYKRKVGYAIESWSEVTPIKDIYAFLSWQLEFERMVRFLDEEGNMIDKKPNSLWKEKHLQPLIELLENHLAEKLEKSEGPLQPTIEETVKARANWVPTYPEIANFLVNRILKDSELISVEECKEFLRKLDKLFKDSETHAPQERPHRVLGG